MGSALGFKPNQAAGQLTEPKRVQSRLLLASFTTESQDGMVQLKDTVQSVSVRKMRDDQEEVGLICSQSSQ